MGKSQNSATEAVVLAGPAGRSFIAAVPSREGGGPKRPPPGNRPSASAQAQPHTTDELEPAEPAAPAGPTPHPGDIRARGRLRRARAWQDWGRRPEARRPGQRGPPRAYGPQRAVAKAAPRPGARPCRSPLNAATPRAFQGNTPVAQDGCHWPAIGRLRRGSLPSRREQRQRACRDATGRGAAVPGPQSAGPGPARALRPELAETRAKENVVYISCCQVYRLQRDSASAVDWIPVQQSRPELL